MSVIAENERERAAFALEKVKEVVGKESDETKKEYKSYCRKFPSLVMTNGLAAAVAFCLDKGGTYVILEKQLSDWFDKIEIKPQGKKLVEYVCGIDSSDYRLATKETISLFTWLKRFATGLIEV
jgi:CRISPR-associated protein Cmr5